MKHRETDVSAMLDRNTWGEEWHARKGKPLFSDPQAYAHFKGIYLVNLKVYLVTLKVYLVTVKAYLVTLKVYLVNLRVYLVHLKVYLVNLKM